MPSCCWSTHKLRTELPSFLPGCKSHTTHHWCNAVNGMMVRRQNPVLKQLKSLQWYLEWRLGLWTRQNRLLYDRVIHCLTRKTDCFVGSSSPTNCTGFNKYTALLHVSAIVSVCISTEGHIYIVLYRLSITKMVKYQYTINTFTAIVDLSRFNNSCLKSRQRRP